MAEQLVVPSARLSRREFLAACAALALAGCGPVMNHNQLPRPEANPLAGKTLFIDPGSAAARDVAQLRPNHPDQAALLERIASQPMADWYGEWSGDIAGAVDRRVTQIADTGSLPVMVLYNLPGRDNGNYSAGGAPSNDTYLQWISGVASGLAGREAAIIFEPDGLGLLDDRQPNQPFRLPLMREAIRTLTTQPNVHLYIDASWWITPRDMAQRLQLVDVHRTAGVAINTSAYLTLDRNQAYLRGLQTYLPNLHAVIDTSRNGRAIPDGDWCNPPDAALGHPPTTTTSQSFADAYLWIKRPGESDGTCNGGLAAGLWWRDQALSLARNTAGS